MGEDESHRSSPAESQTGQAPADPYLTPKADLGPPAANAQRTRPSFALVVVLALTQLAFAVGIGVCTAAFNGKPWLGTQPLGALLGSMLLGALESPRRAHVRTTVSFRQLAFSVALMWCPLGMAVFAIVGKSILPRDLPVLWLGMAGMTAILCLVHWAVTLLGLWLGSQISPEESDS
jgi:hypothetical protein